MITHGQELLLLPLPQPQVFEVVTGRRYMLTMHRAYEELKVLGEIQIVGSTRLEKC